MSVHADERNGQTQIAQSAIQHPSPLHTGNLNANYFQSLPPQLFRVESFINSIRLLGTSWFLVISHPIGCFMFKKRKIKVFPLVMHAWMLCLKATHDFDSSRAKLVLAPLDMPNWASSSMKPCKTLFIHSNGHTTSSHFPEGLPNMEIKCCMQDTHISSRVY